VVKGHGALQPIAYSASKKYHRQTNSHTHIHTDMIITHIDPDDEDGGELRNVYP
jgi:hypothetical protein